MNFKLKISTLLILALSVIFCNATQIAFLADIHVTPGNENEQKLKDVILEINKSQCDVVVLAGDLTNEGSDEELLNVKNILDDLTKPIYVIPGNHENNWSQSACKTFNDLWKTDRFVADLDSVVIVGMNCGPFMKMGDGHIKQEDLLWLDKTLKKYSDKTIISVNHYPLMSDLDNYIDYIKILEKYKVAVHLNGHYHTVRRYKGGDIDALMNRALYMKKGNYGYTIIDIVNDSIKQWDKELNKSPQLVNAFKINHNLKPIESEVLTYTNKPNGYQFTQIYKDKASIFTRLGIDKSRIYFGNSLGEAKAIDKKSGKDIWHLKTEASLFSRPAVSKNYAIIPTADKRLIWVNKKSGKIEYQMYSQGPYVADGVVVNEKLYQGGYKLFEAWNVNTKQPIWRCSTENYCQAAPVVTTKDVTFGAWDTFLRNVDITTGRMNWKWNNGRKANMLGPGNVVPIVTEDKVIIVAPDRYMTAINRITGKQIWRSNQYKFRESLGCSEDGKTAYAKTMDGELVAVSTEGTEYNPLWKVDLHFGYEHAPCIVLESKGVVYVGSRGGLMAAVNPKEGKLIWIYRLGTSEFNGFEVDEKGDIYCSLIEGTIWRISKIVD